WHQLKVNAGSYKRSSIENWRNHVNHYIVPELGSGKVRQLTIEAIEEAARKWSQRVSPKMVGAVMTTLGADLDLAKRYKLIRDNSSREAERPMLETAYEDSVRL